MEYFVNAGIYLIEPRVQALVRQDTTFNMPDLIARLISAGERVVVFPVREYRIGKVEDCRRAQNDIGTGRVRLSTGAAP